MPDSERRATCFTGAQRSDPNVSIFIPGLLKAQACQDFGMARMNSLELDLKLKYHLLFSILFSSCLLPFLRFFKSVFLR